MVEIQPLLGTEPALLELAACGVYVAAARVADGCLHAMHGESTLERFDLLDGRRTKWAVGNVIELNEVDVAERPRAEVDKSLHLRVRVIDTIDHGELICRAAPGLFDVELNGLMKAKERIFFDPRHELVAGALNRRVKGDGKRELLGKFGESADARDDAAGRNGQVASANCKPVGVVKDAKSLDGGVEVSERLALAHEDDARHALAEVSRNVKNLIDHLLRREGAREPCESRGAECAAHGASCLRGDADGELVAVGHADSLHGDAVGELQEVLA